MKLRHRPVTNKRKPAPNPLRIDPTRTAGLRRRFKAQLDQRFNRLRLKVFSLIFDEDAFGLKPKSHDPFTVNVRWKFNADAEKIKAFQEWLRSQVFVELTGKTEEEIWAAYIEEGFRKGAGRAFDDVKKPALARTKPEFFAGTKDEFLRRAFGQPIAVEKVKLLAGRSFDDLKGITSDMSLKMSRKLTDGLVQGKGPREIARELAKEVDITRDRATVIARTEIVRAHAEGQLTALETLGVEEVGVAVEWSTTGDDRVCELCAPLEGVVLKLEEARGMLPRHPSCRCAWLPAGVGEDGAAQKDTKTSITKSIKASVKEEGGKAASTWVGADKTIDKARPESILNQWQQRAETAVNQRMADGYYGPEHVEFGKELLAFSRWVVNADGDCGIGPGGFQPGNTCAQGGGGGIAAPEHIEAARAMVAAHPRPGKEPPPIPGELVRQDPYAKTPIHAAAAKAHDEHAQAKARSRVAELVKDTLTNPPEPLVPLPKPGATIGKQRRLLDDAKTHADSAEVHKDWLGPQWAKHSAVVAASHPAGQKVLEVARAEAGKRYEAAKQQYEAHQAAWHQRMAAEHPQYTRAKTELESIPEEHSGKVLGYPAKRTGKDEFVVKAGGKTVRGDLEKVFKFVTKASTTTNVLDDFSRFVANEIPPLARDFPHISQSFNYDCGAACMRGICLYYHRGPTEEAELIQLLGTTPEDGTTVVSIVDTARRLGLVVEQFEDDTNASQLRQRLERGQPVICPVQMYGTTPEYDAEEIANDDGHYVVALSCDGETVICEDPSAAGRIVVPLDRFIEIWHDVDLGNDTYTRTGIAFGGVEVE